MELTTQHDAVADAADRFLDGLAREFYDRMNARIESREIERDMERFRQRHRLLQEQLNEIRDVERGLLNRMRYAKPDERVVLKAQVRSLRNKRADVMVRMSDGELSREEALEAIDQTARQSQAKAEKAAELLTAPVRGAAGTLDAAPATTNKGDGRKPVPARRGGRALPKKG